VHAKYKGLGSVILSLVASAVLMAVSCQSGKPDEDSDVKIKAAPRAQNLLRAYKDILDDQKKGQDQEAEFQERDDEEKIMKVAIDGNLDELFSLDPADAKDTNHIKELTDDLFQIGPMALEVIHKMLSEDRPARDKILLTMAIGRFNNDESAKYLFEEATDSSDRDVRKAALSNLKKSPNKEWLIQRAVDRYKQGAVSANANDQKQASAIAVLGALGGDRAVDEIYYIYMTSIDPQLKKAAIEALGDIGDDAKGMLYSIFQDDEAMRDAAAEAMGQWRDEEIATMFGETLIRENANGGLKLAAVKGLGADNGVLSRKILSDVLYDTRQVRAVHQAAIDMLLRGYDKLPTGELDAYLRCFETSPIDYLPQLIQPLLAKGKEDAVPKLSSIYPQLDQIKKIHLVRTLGRIRGRSAFQTLKEKLSSEGDPSLQREILSAIMECNSDELRAEIVALFHDVVMETGDKELQLEASKHINKILPADALSMAK
jgi:hypothetical protein